MKPHAGQLRAHDLYFWSKKKNPLFCSSAISTLEGIESKRRLQTLSIDNAWSNKIFLLDHAMSMDNVCNHRLFSNPLFPIWLVAISSSAFRLG